MKTPWRFVSDLVLRKPADKPQETPPPAVVDHEGKPEQTTAVEATPADLSADRNTHDKIEAAPTVSAEPASETPEPEHATADTIAPASETVATDVEQEPVAATPAPEPDASTPAVEQVPAIAAPTAPEPKARSASKRAKVLAPATPQTPVEVAVAAPKSLLEEMTDLDHEIATLRRQLSAKLAKQNAQMRELLDRYEAR